MKRRNTVCMVMAVGLMLGMATGVCCADDETGVASGRQAGALITLDDMAALADLERPAVQFKHDVHTDVLGQAKSCRQCHALTEAGGGDFGVVGIDGLSAGDARDAWHKQCMACHHALTKKGAASGPLTCGGCHVRDLPAVEPPGATAFYDNYHGLHEYLEGGCGLCHHAYDESAETLYYEPGTEEACWRCHQDQPQARIPSLRQAAHSSCVSCHIKTVNQEEIAVPVDCSGCHNDAR